MPNLNHQGMSKTTLKKESILESILIQNISIVKRIGEKHDRPICYLFIDACSGTGMNPEIIGCKGIPCKGSPLIFMDTIEKFKIAYNAHFIERDLQNYSTLCKNLKERKSTVIKYGVPFPLLPFIPFDTSVANPNGGYQVYNADYHDKIFEILNAPIKNMAYDKGRNWMKSGIIYFDPNSFPDFKFVEELSRHSKCKYIDLLFHFSATSLKRASGAFPEKYTILKEYIAPIDKEFWFVRKLGETAHQMAFLLGTNMPNYEVKAPGWYNVDSNKGQDIINKLSLTKETYDQIKVQKDITDSWGAE